MNNDGISEAQELYGALIGAANKAMGKGMPAWVAKLMAERLAEDLRHIPEGMSAQVVVQSPDGSWRSPDVEVLVKPDKIISGTTTVNFRDRTVKSEVTGEGPGAQLLSQIRRHLH